MKRTISIICTTLAAILVLVLIFSLIFKGHTIDRPVNAGNSTISENTNTNSTIVTGTEGNPSKTGYNDGGENNQNIPDNERVQLLQSASVDLDGDGENEQVKAVQAEIRGKSEVDPTELEGRLIISDNEKTITVPFTNKRKEFTDAMSRLEFKDLDMDGIKDVFIIIPDSGASFSLNYYFIYNYKTGGSYSYKTDSSLLDFAGSFEFEYKSKGLLNIRNKKYNLSADFNLTDDSAFDTNDGNNESYNNSWVEPTPIEISENSRIALVSDQSKSVQIKVPLPVFGQAAADIIGEVDLFYQVNSKFQPILKRFEILDFNKDTNKKIAEYILTN